MCEILKTFLESQLFGIIVGAILTGGFTWFTEWRKSVGEQKVHLREKREETYLRVIDVLTRHEKCYREKRVIEDEYEEYKKAFNDLQSYMMVYASPTIYKEYYKLCNDITDTYIKIKKRKDRENMVETNAKKIEKFADKIRKELGIEGDVSWL